MSCGTRNQTETLKFIINWPTLDPFGQLNPLVGLRVESTRGFSGWIGLDRWVGSNRSVDSPTSIDLMAGTVYFLDIAHIGTVLNFC